MEKESLPQAEKTMPQPERADTKLLIELEFDMLKSTITLKSKAPTVVLSGILRKAEFAAHERIAAVGDARRIIIDYDLVTDEARVRTDADPLIARGIFVMAYSMMTTSQVLQRFQAAQAGKPNQRLHRVS